MSDEHDRKDEGMLPMWVSVHAFRLGELKKLGVGAIPMAADFDDFERWLLLLISTLAPRARAEIHLSGDFYDEEDSEGINRDLVAEVQELLMSNKVPDGYWVMLRLDPNSNELRAMLYRER